MTKHRLLNSLLFCVLVGLWAGCSSDIKDESKTSAPTQNHEISSFESCLIAGGLILESDPRQCEINGEHYEEAGYGKPGETIDLLFSIEPETVSCQGLHPVDQVCLVINGEFFYEPIEGYTHQAGQRALIKVRRTQLCDPETLNSCPQDASIFSYTMLENISDSTPVSSQSELTFVGKIASIEDGRDGSIATLSLKDLETTLRAVVSIPNLAPGESFNFDALQVGNWLKVTGEPFTLGDSLQMAVRKAQAYTPVHFADIKATANEITQCSNAGGQLIKAGKLQADRCLQSYPDAKQACQDATDCFGDCLLPADAKQVQPGEQVNGICASDNRRFGCRPLVSNGQFEGTLCID